MYKIYNEDCMQTMSRMKDGEVDVIFTSPPYNYEKVRRNTNVLLSYDAYHDNMDYDEYMSWLGIWTQEMLRVTRHHVFVVLQASASTKRAYVDYYNHWEPYIKEMFLWAKTNPQASVNAHCVSSAYEHIFCLSHDDPSKRSFKYCNFNQRGGVYIVSNVVVGAANHDKESRHHGYAFPEWLASYFIKHFSKVGSTIYDPFGGTGTTCKMAVVQGRHGIMSEISGKWCRHAEDRLSRASNNTSLFIEQERV